MRQIPVLLSFQTSATDFFQDVLSIFSKQNCFRACLGETEQALEILILSISFYDYKNFLQLQVTSVRPLDETHHDAVTGLM